MPVPRKRNIENLWWKLLITVLVIVGPIIVVSYLYYKSSSCLTSVWNCFEFEAIMLGGGVLFLSFPIIVILAVWEMSIKIIKKRTTKKDK